MKTASERSAGRSAASPVTGNERGGEHDAAGAEHPVYCISHVYGHHAAASGYHHAARYFGRHFSPGPKMSALGNSVIRLPAKVAAAYGGVYEYNRHSVTGEVAVALSMLRMRGAVYHFLYGEKGYRFLGRMNRVRDNVLVGTFHHAPSRFDEMVGSKRHLRHLEHAVAMADNQVELLERYVGAGKVTIVPHGIDTKYWQPQEHRREAGPWQCVFAGLHMRDYATLHAAIQRVRAARRDIEFTLLCSHEACAPITALEGVRWLRRSTDDEYRQAMKDCDVLFLPLTDSTAVNSVLEALACGVPVVTNTGGIDGYLNADCARIHPVGDAVGMAESLLAIFDDTSLLRSMQVAARRRALELDWTQVAAQMANVYRRLYAN